MKSFLLFINGLALCTLLFFGSFDMSIGASTIPRKINYQGRLLNASGTVVSTPVVFRFSIWTDADFVVATDWTASGAILGSAPDYISWSEEQIIIPDSQGLFAIEIGAVNPLPDLDFSLAKFLQIDLKNQGDSDLSYEVLDPDVDDPLDDRKPLNSSPYTFNADQVDNADIGTGSGNLVILGPDGKFSSAFIPGSTDDSFFVIDADDSEAVEISLQFGQTLSKTLSYDISNGWFIFNDNLRIEGDLNLSGDLSASGNIILGSSSGNTLDINAKLGSDLDFNQHEAFNFVLHSGASFPVSPLAGQKFYRSDLNREFVFNGTDWIASTLVTNDRMITLSPEYPNFTIIEDGSDNTGTLISNFDEGIATAKRIYYRWSSNKLSLQDLDLIIKVQLPSDFGSWQAVPLTIDYQTADAVTTNNKLDVVLFDTAGDTVSLSGGADLASANWATANLTFAGSPTFAANGYLIFKIKLSALIGKYAQIADIKLHYSID